MLDEIIDSDSEKLNFRQYWEISNGKDSTYAYITEGDLLMAEFFLGKCRRCLLPIKQFKI